MKSNPAWLVGAAAFALLPCSQAVAQSETSPQAEEAGSGGEIIVTAQRREQRLNDVPISISAFSDEYLDDHQISKATDLITFTPGLSGYTYGASNPRIAVRGVLGSDFGVGGDSTIGVYIDDFFIGRMSASVTQLFDVERVEVLKGPQGALVGRNSTAGAIGIITRKPGDDLAVDFRLRGANLDERQADIGIDLPLSDSVGLRLAGRARQRHGYQTNVVDGVDFDHSRSFSGRAVLVAEASPDLKFTLVGEVNSTRGRPPGYKSSYQVVGGLLGLSPADASAFFSPGTNLDPFDDFASDLTSAGNGRRWRDDQDVWQIYGRVEYDLGGATLTSITGYRDYRLRFGSDDDGTLLQLLNTFQNEDGKEFSQELRVIGSIGRIDYVVGANYLHEKIDVVGEAQYDEALYGVGVRPGVVESAFVTTRNDGWGFFGDVTANLTDKLAITAGLRYSIDRKKFSQFIPIDPVRGFNLVIAPTVDPGISMSETWRSLQPRANIQYKWTPDVMTYVSIAKGYRSGGFNSFGFQPAFNPETVWNYEAGLKASFWDGKADVQVSAFHYDYNNLQVLVPAGGAFIVRNAASAQGDGGELQFSARPAKTLSFSTGVSILNAKYGSFVVGAVDRSGNRLARAPKFTVTSTIGWTPRITDALSGKLQLTHSYRSRTYFDSNESAFASQKGFHQFDGSVGIASADDRWGLSVFMNNIGNKRYLASAGGLAGDTWVAAAPRSYGVELTGKF